MEISSQLQKNLKFKIRFLYLNFHLYYTFKETGPLWVGFIFLNNLNLNLIFKVSNLIKFNMKYSLYQ